MNDPKDKPPMSIFRRLDRKDTKETEKDEPTPVLAPAMPELGTAPCPVCGHKVAVFVTRTKRPFINCGFCSARIFFNGSRSMQLLKKQLEADEDGGSTVLDSLRTIHGGKP
jgi:DNA-directed RNA polymerase subunit RPC12/RpoP